MSAAAATSGGSPLSTWASSSPSPSGSAKRSRLASRVTATPSPSRRPAQKSSAASVPTRHTIECSMPAPALPGAAPGNSKKVRIEPGEPASSP